MRLATGKTVRELAADAGLSYQLVSKIESGKSVRVDSINRLVEAAGARFVAHIEPAGEVGVQTPPLVPASPPDRLAIASRFMALLPRLPDSLVDQILTDISLWESEHPPEH